MLNTNEGDKSNMGIKQSVKFIFKQLCIRFKQKTTWWKHSIPLQQTGLRILLHLQARVENELNKLIDQKHIVTR